MDVPGFASFVRDQIPVDVADVAVIDATMQVEGTRQVVTITDTPPQLHTASSSLGTVVEQKTMESVPLSSRNFTQILTLSPGVTANVVDAFGLYRD